MPILEPDITEILEDS